jgi:CBS domain containing-hemolysin-like protein
MTVTGNALNYTFWTAVLLACAMLDAIFSGLETGIYSINKIRLHLRAERGDHAARTLRKMGANVNNILSVLLIGTNLARYAATFSISIMFVMAGAGNKAEWYTMAVATPVLFVFMDSFPKSVFQRLSEILVYKLTWLLRASSIFFNVCGLAPLVRGFAAGLLRLFGGRKGATHLLGHLGVETVFVEGRASGVLTDFQSDMAGRTIAIADLPLRDIMTPLAKAAKAPINIDRPALTELIRRHDHSRLPLCDDGTVVGILNVYEMLISTDEGKPADLARPPLILPASKRLTDALVELQQANAAIAVVADRSGRHIGIVTVKDIARRIVGDTEELAEDCASAAWK